MKRDWTELVEFACQGDLQAVRDRVAGSIETPGAPADELRGILAYRAGDDPNAVEALSKAAAAGMLSSRSLVFLLRVQYRQGATEEALETAGALLRREPGDPDGLQTIARIHNQRGRWTEAERCWRTLSDATPDHPEASKQAMRIAVRNKDWDAAALYAERHLRLDAANPEVLETLLGARFRQRHLAGMREVLVAFHDVEPTRACAFLDRLERPDEIVVCAEVIRHLRAAAPKDAGMRDLAAAKGEAWLQLGLRRELARADLDAAAAYRASRTVRPQHRASADGLARLARGPLAAMREARRDCADGLAAEAAETVLRVDPESAEAAYILGRIRIGEADGAAAVAAFRAALAGEPANPRLMFNLARAEERAGEAPAALRSFRHVVACGGAGAPRSREAERASGRIARRLLASGQAARAEGRFDEAWDCFRAVAASGVPESVKAQTMLGVVLKAALDDLKTKFKTADRNALAAAESYIEKDGDNIQALRIYGRLLSNAKFAARALPVWEKLGAMESGEPLYALQAARCCVKLKLADRGIAQAQRALRLSPDLAEAAQILRQLSGDRAAA